MAIPGINLGIERVDYASRNANKIVAYRFAQKAIVYINLEVCHLHCSLVAVMR